MGHLILDRLCRRRFFLYLLALALLYPPVLLPVTALMMIGTWFSWRTSREILQLPLSRRQLWRTRWILAFTVPLLYLFGRLAQLGIAAAAGREAPFSLSWALLTFLVQLSTLGILAVMSGPIRQRASKLLRPLKRFHDYFFYAVYPAGYVLVALVTVGAAVDLASPAYRQMAEWSAGMILWLAVGLCVGAISFFHSPQIAPRSVMGGPEPFSVGSLGAFVCRLVKRSPRESQGANETRPLTKSWPTGTTFLVWTQIIRRAVRAAMISGPLYILLWWGLSKWPLLATILLFGGLFGSSIWGTDTLDFRHQRVLPLSTRTLAAIFTLLQVLSCLCSWVVPVAAYWIMFGPLPWWLRPEVLSGVAGLVCLADAAELNAVGTPARILPRLLLFVASGFGFAQLSGTPLPLATTGLIGLLGLACIAASFVLNARALRRSGSIYKSVLSLSSLSQPRWISE